MTRSLSGWKLSFTEAVEALGQRAYNGVALLSKEPARDIVFGLPGDDGDDHARYLEATFGPPGAEAVLFSVDYPYESSYDAVAGFERTTLSDTDRNKIAHGNAERLLKLT